MKKRIYKHVSRPYEAIILIEGEGRTHYEWRDPTEDQDFMSHPRLGKAGLCVFEPKAWGITCVSTEFFHSNWR